MEIREGQSVLSLTCTPSSAQLSVLWREGQTRLTETTSGVTLAPASHHHQLTLNLNTFSLTGEDIVYEVLDPEDDRRVVASANIEIALPTGEVNHSKLRKNCVFYSCAVAKSYLCGCRDVAIYILPCIQCL